MNVYFKTLLGLLVLVTLISPISVWAKTYTLSDGSAFAGTESERQYAELLLGIEYDLPTLLEDSWSATTADLPFPSLDTIAAGASFSGDAGYDPATKSFYMTNTKGDGLVTFKVKHSLTSSKIHKIISSFVTELQKNIDQYAADSGVRVEPKVRKGSNLYTRVQAYYAVMGDVGTKLGTALNTVVVDTEGKTNKMTDQPILMYLYTGKNYPFTSKDDRHEYYMSVSPTFATSTYFENQKGLGKTLFVNIGIDPHAAVNTKVTFKLSDLRALSTLQYDDIWDY